MHPPVPSPALRALADLYRASQAGVTGLGERPFSVALAKLLAKARCEEGDAHQLAVEELWRADNHLVHLVPEHPRDPRTIGRIHLPVELEAAFFAHLGQESPRQQRTSWVEFFRDAAQWPIPVRDAAAWREFCLARETRAATWELMAPFQMAHLARGRERVEKLARLLAWDYERGGRRHLVRWVSSLVAGDSKYLERTQSFFESLLAEATGGRITRYSGIGIEEMPRKIAVHGPLRLLFPDGTMLDIGALQGATEVDLQDLQRGQIECLANRCLTVENKTPFADLVAKQSGVLLVHTSYPNDATVELLRKLPDTMEFWHFGDTDPQGFDILRDLRTRTGRAFRPLAMRHRPAEASAPLSAREAELVNRLLEDREFTNLPEVRHELQHIKASGLKGDFEQESLPPPPLAEFPFYPEN